MNQFVDVDALDLESAFTQLGMADYTLLETTEFIDRLNDYRSKLMNKIRELQYATGNDQSLDDAEKLCDDDGKQGSDGILAD